MTPHAMADPQIITPTSVQGQGGQKGENRGLDMGMDREESIKTEIVQSMIAIIAIAQTIATRRITRAERELL